MSLQPFIYNFGGGKIQLKYRIIEEKYNKTKRSLIESIMIFVIIGEIAIGVAVLNESYALLGLGIGFVITIFIEKQIYKIINASTQTGTIFFYEDHLVISKVNDVSISYRDLKNIYFKMNLGSHRQGDSSPGSNARQAHSYILQISSYGKQYVVQIENDMLLTDEDKMQFHRGYPLLMYTLEELYRLYRIPMEEKPKKFKFEEK